MKFSFLFLLPNCFTIMRLLLIPVFVFLMVNPTVFQQRIALVVFILAAITDFIDGKVARKLGAVTDFGKLLDPIADKVLVMSALVMLLSHNIEFVGVNLIPAWLVVLVLARETWVNCLRSLAATKGVVLAAGWGGKIKSALQMLAICLLLLDDVQLEFFSKVLPLSVLGAFFLFFSVFVSYWGAVEYTLFVFAKKKEN